MFVYRQWKLLIYNGLHRPPRFQAIVSCALNKFGKCLSFNLKMIFQIRKISLDFMQDFALDIKLFHGHNLICVFFIKYLTIVESMKLSMRRIRIKII